MATIIVTGKPWEFTITGHTDNGPIVGATITNNGYTFTVTATTVTGGSGVITATNPAGGVPALISSLVCSPSNIPSGKWTAQIPDGDVHLKEIPAFAAGDSIAITNSAKGFVRLVVDGEDAADMAKLTNRPAEIGYTTGVSCELLVKNASTTTPMVIEFNGVGQQGFRWLGEQGLFRMEGDWIELAYTSDGTRGQSFNLDIQDLNGRYIDNPPFIEAQRIAGDNTSWVPLLNIGGGDSDTQVGYKWKSNTAYLLPLFACEFGQQYETGPIFEFDEYNGGAAYGKVYLGKNLTNQQWVTTVIASNAASPAVGTVVTAHGGADTFVVAAITTGNLSASATYRTMRLKRTGGATPLAYGDALAFASGASPQTVTGVSTSVGGWVPPNGAKFRIPNIHITQNRAVVTSGGANANLYGYVAVGGAYGDGKANFNCVSFSDLMCSNGACWNYFNSVTFTNVGIVLSAWYRSGTNKGAMTYNGFNIAPNKNFVSQPYEIGQGNGAFNLNGVLVTAKGNNVAPLLVQAQLDAKTIKNVHSIYPIGSRVTGSYLCFQLSGIYGKGEAPVDCSDWTLIGHGGVNFRGGSNNIYIERVVHSHSSVEGMQPDASVGQTGVFYIQELSRDIAINNIRQPTGGVGSTGSILSGSSTGNNVSMHDVIYSSKNANTGTHHGSSVAGHVPDNIWVANCEVEGFFNNASSVMSAPKANGRISNISSTSTAIILNNTGAMQVDNAQSMTANIGGTVTYADAPPFQLYRTGGVKTAGSIACIVGALQENVLSRTDVVGTYGSTMFGDGRYFYCSGIFTCRWINQAPMKGITDIPNTVTITFNGNAISTLTLKFRLAKWGDALSGSYTTLNAANIAAAFGALTGYDSNVGLKMEIEIEGLSDVGVWGRYVQNVQIDGLVLDGSYAPSEIGFVEVEAFGLPQYASMAMLKSGVQTEYLESLSASGRHGFTYPCNFTLAGESFEMVARRPGWAEARLSGTVYIKALSMPMAMVEDYPVTSGTPEAITGVTPNGSAKTLTLTAQLVDAYDHSQWWSCQEANMIHAVPLTSSNGSVFTQPADWTVISATLDGSKTLAGGTLQIGTAGTYTPALSDLTIKMTATGSYDLTDATLSGVITLTNTSGAAIDVAMPSLVGYSIVNTGTGAAAVNVTYPTVARGLDFDGVLAGSTVKVFATGTQTVIATPTGPNWIWSESGGTDVTVDYTIQKAGYDPIRVTGVTVNSAVLPVAVQQQVARSYVASSGLTFDTNCYADPDTKLFGLANATKSTLQNFYSHMVESWITEPALQNKPFPITPNGPNSFTLGDGWDWDLTTYPNSVSNLSRDGMRLVDAGGTVTAIWAAILSVGVPAGMQVCYQQQDGLGTTNAQNTGNIDQLIKIYKTGTGAFDYRDWLVLKVQVEGYDQAEAIAFDIYGAMEDQLYVFGLTPLPNGIAAGAADATVTITSEPTPVLWNGQYFSTTIEDTDNSHSGLEIMQAIRALNDFNMHDMIRPHGTKFQTVTGNVYGDTLTTPAGVRVVKADGTTPHPDFDLFVADNASTYVPPVVAPIEWAGALDGTTVLLYNDVGGGAGVIIDTQVISGAGGYNLDVSLPSVDVAVGDPLRIRFGHKQYYAGEIQGTMTSTGWTAVGTMVLHPVYAAWGLDGAVYDQGHTPPGPYVMDGTHLQVDIAAGATTGLKTQLGAWTQYLMTLPAGLAAFYGAWDLLAVNQIRQNVGVIDVMIDVPTAGALFSFTDNDVNYYRSDFTFPGNVEAGHGLIAMTYNASIFVPDPVIISGSSVITGSINDVTGKVQDGLTAQGFTITRALKLDNLDVAVSTRMAGADFVIPPTPEANATAIFAQAGITPMPSDMKKTNGEQIVGNGSAADKFRSHLVP